MREESHLDDMRAAIRGDFERLEERRGEQELMRIVEAEPEPPEPEVAPLLQADVEVASAAEPEPRGEAADPEPEPGPRAHKTWLDHLLGR